MRNTFLPFCMPTIGEAEINSVVNVLRSGWLSSGSETSKFETVLAEYVGAKHAIAVNSCTAALHLSLIALGVGQGDEVITTPFTFAATGNVIVHVGAKPVFVDIKRDTYNIDTDKIKAAITSRTKAIIPVHYAGQPCDMGTISQIAQENKLLVIEDAAHAIGAAYQGNKIGSLSKATCFSFYATKNITTGEGGAITTNDDKLAHNLRSLRLHGISKDAWNRYSEKGTWYYEIEDCGWKYNMSDIQAAIGIQQLNQVDDFTNTRRSLAATYSCLLGDTPGIATPFTNSGADHVYHLYPILLTEMDRALFIDKMRESQIGCSVHFIPLHLHPYYQKHLGLKRGDFPNAEWVFDHEVSLPLYPQMTIQDVSDVVEAVHNIIGS